MPNRSRSGVVSSPLPRGRADQREGRQVDSHAARRWSLADNDVERAVLHRRIEHLLDDRVQAVDLVNKQHVVRFEIGEQRRQVAGLADHGAGGGAKSDTKLARNDLRQRRLAQARGSEEQHMIHRLPRGNGRIR